jgi:hypothetical protein
MNSIKDITLNIQHIDERSAGLLNRTRTEKILPRNAERGKWLEARLGCYRKHGGPTAKVSASVVVSDAV